MSVQQLNIRTNQLTSGKSTSKTVFAKTSFTDEQIMAAIQSSLVNTNRLVIKWFFEEVKGYAIGVWRKKYNNLPERAWENIFTNSTIKLILRIKKGLQLKEGTKLKSYFTTIVGYAVLDYFAERKKETTLPIDPTIKMEPTQDSYAFEQQQTAHLIKAKLIKITNNREQVNVMLLFAKGYKYKEIVTKTAYESEGACRNAYLKGKKKIINYFIKYPTEGQEFRKMLLEAI